jgi:two-component system cell cycle response regulator DivK
MGFRVLVVEDTEDNRLIMRDALESVGIEVLQAVDGPSGLEAAAREMPDLIIMDAQMPEMNGFDATRRLKADPALRHIPVIAATAYALAGDMERCLEAGCDDYIAKPFSPRDLIRKVKRYEEAARDGR